ncbi:MAG: DUF128 domain-containing protein [Methanotrichaceae archaeon]
MTRLIKAHTGQRKLVEILRVINQADKPTGARTISDELSNRGYEIGERAVRYNLKILDELGFTKRKGYSGRVLTSLGMSELRDALVDDRIGFVNTRIEEYMYKTSFDPGSASGDVVVNTSFIDKKDYERVVGFLQNVFDAGYTMSKKVMILDEGEEIGSEEVLKGSLAISTICSITTDGMLLKKGGILVDTTFAGVVKIKNGNSEKFTELIAYDGSSLDPMKVFVTRRTARINNAVNSGNGRILVSLREIPITAVSQARQLLAQAKAVGIGGLIKISEPGEPNMSCPVNAGKVGIVLCSGVNATVAIKEAGLPIRIAHLFALADYSKMTEI